MSHGHDPYHHASDAVATHRRPLVLVLLISASILVLEVVGALVVRAAWPCSPTQGTC